MSVSRNPTDNQLAHSGVKRSRTAVRTDPRGLQEAEAAARLVEYEAKQLTPLTAMGR